jgi:WD40 repeat protein/mono/diheme cytochrome c family protein
MSPATHRHLFLIAFGLNLAPAALAADSEPAEIAKQAQTVLKTHCYRCHGDGGSVEGGMNYVLDLSKLVQRKKVVPGKPDESSLWKRIAKDVMPPPEVEERLSETEKSALKRWIESGAPALQSTTPRTFVTQADVNDAILADLEKIDRRSRRFIRYFTFTHLYNAGLTDDELQTYRNALAKLVNSLSWHPKVRNPEPIEPTHTILRIDLRWYMWDAPLWNRVLNDYPYGILDDSCTARAIMVSTASRAPAVRGDWFVATASRPPLYTELLQLPGSLAELERQLRVDAQVNIAQERVMRVAFNGSGISKNNRILERHDAVHGYYWRTYDFEEVPQNLVERGLLAPDRRNVFAYPLGPGNLESNFQHAGGEAIFSLPNGLQGYFIMNAVNNRLDKAPVAIVSDPKRPDRAVELGISCMGCHIPGIHAKADQMHDHLEKNPKALPRIDREVALALYPPKEKSLAQMEEDSKQFREALAKTGVKITKYEPIISMTLRYEGDLDETNAAAEAGIKQEDFHKGIAGSELLSRNLGALRVPGGTVARQVWVQAFGDVVKELKLGVLFQANRFSGSLPDNTGDLDPLEVSGNQSNQMAFSADGRRALIASADRSVRYYEVEGRRDLRRLIGHTASVWCVALSRDGRFALSGSMDGSVRHWRVEDGEQIHKLDGHDSLVTSVAFTADGTRAVSGGLDGVAILWDLDKGTEIRRLEGKGKHVNAVAVAPDGLRALVAVDKLIHVWELETGQVERTLSGHTSAVGAVAFSADGLQAVSGGDDRTVRLWDVKSGKQLQQFTGHENHVKAVASNQSGKWVLTGGADGTVRLWKAATGEQLGIFSKHAEPVVQVGFLDNGKQTLSGSRDTALLLWNIEQFYRPGK